MGIPSLTHDHGHAHTLQYISTQGTILDIAAAHIVSLQNINSDVLIVSTVNADHWLKFDTTEDRAAAHELVEESLAYEHYNTTLDEKLLNGSLFNANSIDLKVPPTGYLDTWISVAAKTEIHLYIAMLHGGDVLGEVFVAPTLETEGDDILTLSRNPAAQKNLQAIFKENPTVSNTGTKIGEQFLMGKGESSMGLKRGTSPTFIFAEGTYLLRTTNISYYWMSMQRRMQFYEGEVK